jgi:hypothetical protein
MRSSVYLLGDIALFSVFTVTHAVTDAKTDAVQENRSPVTHCALRLVVTLAKKIACGQYGCRCHRDKAKLYSGTYPVIKAGLPESDCPENYETLGERIKPVFNLTNKDHQKRPSLMSKTIHAQIESIECRSAGNQNGGSDLRLGNRLVTTCCQRAIPGS